MFWAEPCGLDRLGDRAPRRGQAMGLGAAATCSLSNYIHVFYMRCIYKLIGEGGGGWGRSTNYPKVFSMTVPINFLFRYI